MGLSHFMLGPPSVTGSKDCVARRNLSPKLARLSTLREQSIRNHNNPEYFMFHGDLYLIVPLLI